MDVVRRKNIPTIVFEDDFVLSPSFESVIRNLMSNESLWDFVRLQGLYQVPYKDIARFEKFNLVKI